MNRQTLLKVAKAIAIWLPTLFLAFVFFAAGAAKFSDAGDWAVAFRKWGYADWFRYTVGFAELLAAAFLLIRRTAPLGAMLVIALMLGGIGTHIVAADKHLFRSELGPIIFATYILVMRRSELTALRRGEWRASRPLASA